jgi:hypothetical protein
MLLALCRCGCVRSANLNGGKLVGPARGQTRGRGGLQKASNGLEIQMSGLLVLHLGTFVFTISRDNCT